jgi:hypothetical protein
MRSIARFALPALLLALAALCSFSNVSAEPSSTPCVPTCLYTSDLNYEVGVIDGIALTDPARGNYKIPLLIRYPKNVAGPLPVVIWHHGGNPSKKGKKRSENWGNTLAAGGYVVIHPSRLYITNPNPFMAECQANGFATPTECAYWVTQFRYGPQSVHFLIDSFAAIEAADLALNGLLDETRIVIGGHSAGSTDVLTSAGAWQRWVKGGTKYDEHDDRPIAFMASGVQGPMYAAFNSGFQSESYTAIDGRPFLFITGFGDTNGNPAESRVTGWLRSTAGDKFLSWDTETEAVHETMNIHKCDTPLRLDHCTWIGSAGLAFVDAYVRGRQEAIDWLASDAYETLTGGAIELHER